MINNFDDLINEIHKKYLSINDELLRAFYLIFVSWCFAQVFIKCIYDNKKEILWQKV